MDTCSRLEEPGGVGWNSTSVIYGRVQAASGRSGCIEWPLGRIGGQGTWSARFRAAAVGGATRGQAGGDGGGAAPHNAGDAVVGGPRGGDRPSAARERSAPDGAGHFKKLSSAVARLCGVETVLCYRLR